MPSRKRAVRSPTNKPTARSLGIDLGATKVVAGLIDRRGRILQHSGRHVHANDGPGGVIRTIVRAVSATLGEEPIRGVPVGIAVAAQIEPRTGTVVHAPNLGWRDVPLARRLQAELGVPVAVINDARAATIAEWTYGAGAGSSDMFLLAIGTGVGGSAVLGGHLIEGGTHAFGEVGHMTLVVGGRRCHCPNWGCFEAYVGGWAIAERAQEAIREDPAAGAGLVARAGGAAESVSAQTVVQAYRAGDPLAQQLVRETERYLADGAVSVVNAFNPSVLVLSGGIVTGLPEFLPVVESAIRARCQPSAAGARVVAARFGEDAALVGAGVIARSARSRA